MKIDIEVPDTVQFCIRMEKEDELYNQCMWARVTFDNKNWSMMAQSDAGDYSYSWCVETEGRKFLELMQETDSDYLLCKISDMTRFDLDSTKKTAISWASSEIESERIIKEINRIHVSNQYDFISELKDIEEIREYPDLWECTQFDYPSGAKVFARVFTECIQPEIRKYLKHQN